jgi:hypothetical protein
MRGRREQSQTHVKQRRCLLTSGKKESNNHSQIITIPIITYELEMRDTKDTIIQHIQTIMWNYVI